MLSSISWSQFFLAVGIIVIAYYGITVLLLYSEEIKSFLKGRSRNTDEPDEATDHKHDVLGITREVIGPQAKSQLIGDNSPPKDPVPRFKEPDEELLTGTVSDLLDEIKRKMLMLEGWEKDECLPAFRELLQKYPQLIGTVYQESINYFIANTCSDHFQWNVEPEEIAELWS